MKFLGLFPVKHSRVGALGAVILMLVAGCAPRVEPMGPMVTKPQLNADGFVALDGAVLPIRRWLPEGEPKAVLVGLHGFNDYSKSMKSPGEYWAKNGLAVYAYDQRGFGAAPNRGIWAGTETMASDLKWVVERVRGRHPGKKVFAVGSSMGGAVVLAALTRPEPPDIDGAILVAPAVWGRKYMTMASRTVLWFISNTMPWLPLNGEGLNITPSDNIEMLRALGRDKMMIHDTRADSIKGLVDLMDEANLATSKVKKPLLFLYGEKDEVIPREPTVEALRRLPDNGLARTAIYPKGYHMLMRDLQAETVLKDIAVWVMDPKAALPSGAESNVEALAKKK